MTVLENLTLVMPTYQRQEYALRNMRYWSNTGVTLRVLDGSDTPIENRLLDSFGDNVIYKHDSRSLYERIEGVLSEVDTKYIALIGDDEFYIISAVESCINELEQDDSIVACCGCCIGFDVDKNAGKAYGWLPYGYRNIGYNETMHDSPEERLGGHMQNYIPTLLYGITRSHPWKAAFKIVTERKFIFFAAWELQFEMYISFSGKAKVLKELMWLRSNGEVEPVRCKYKGIEPEVRFKEWWGSSSKQRKEFIKVMSSAYKGEKTEISINYDNAVIHGCNSYIKGLDSLRSSRSTKVRVLFFNFIKYFIPGSFKSFLRNLLGRKRPTFLEVADSMRERGVKVDYDNLIEIQETIYNFHRK
jgi:glycosyltransferase domain-containing protein